MNLDIGTRVVEPELPGCIEWLRVQLLDEVLNASLAIAKALLRAAEAQIRAQQYDPVMTTK